MSSLGRFFASRWGPIITGIAVGVLAPILVKLGNPGNKGICVACFSRDIAGALGLHRAAPVQYIRPEIVGFVLGSLAAALLFREFRPRTGSAPLARFLLGMFAVIGALVFLGCPWRAYLRLGGGDWNAIFGILGLLAGIVIGVVFLRMGYSLGRNRNAPAALGWLMPALAVADLFNAPDPLRVIFTLNATHAINLALHGVLRPGDRVVASGIEHNAVLRPLRAMTHSAVPGTGGQTIDLAVIPCHASGALDLAAAERLITPGVRLWRSTTPATSWARSCLWPKWQPCAAAPARCCWWTRPRRPARCPSTWLRWASICWPSPGTRRCSARPARAAWSSATQWTRPAWRRCCAAAPAAAPNSRCSPRIAPTSSRAAHPTAWASPGWLSN